MDKRELVRIVSRKTGMTQMVVAKMLSSMIGTIEETLYKGDSITFMGVGTLKVVNYKPRLGYNPNKRIVEALPARKSIKFIPAKIFLKPLNSNIH